MQVQHSGIGLSAQREDSPSKLKHVVARKEASKDVIQQLKLTTRFNQRACADVVFGTHFAGKNAAKPFPSRNGGLLACDIVATASKSTCELQTLTKWSDFWTVTETPFRFETPIFVHYYACHCRAGC
jgi:hypothetical protein